MGFFLELKCLLDAQNSNKVKITQKCADSLVSRRELWNLADVSDDLTGIQDLYVTINKSKNRWYIYGVIIMLVCVVFALGCSLRPALSRNRWDKLK